MAELTVDSISEMLNEEKWTRTSLNSYTINNFEELDGIIEATFNEGIQKDVKELCDEHAIQAKNSIIALYLSGIISLSKQLIDDSNLIRLINIFSGAQKWNIVEFLANRMLEFGENKYALRTLAECYQNKGEEEKIYDIWERLIKVDYEEADIVKLLAEKKDEEGDGEEAFSYYKKAIHRYISKASFSNIKEVWGRLVEFKPDDIDLYFQLEKKVAKALESEKAVLLLEEVYPYFEDSKDWDTSIEILKRILSYDETNPWARKEITSCYKEKYNDHSQLDEYIKLSNLGMSWRNVHEAISDFEKHISFDEGNFVFHRSWGIGVISKIANDQIIIDFARKRGHSMALKMAVNALMVLDKEHIWVLKAIHSKAKLKAKIKKDIAWGLKTIIKSFGNACDMKKIKAEIVPSILTPGEWTSWSSEARRILKTDSDFGNMPDKIDQFVVRTKPISFEEKTFNKFKAEKSFFNRLQTIQDFLNLSNPDSEYFADMFNYFVGFLKSYASVNEFVLSSFLVVKKIVSQYPYLNPGINFDFEELFEMITDIKDVFNKLEDPEIKKEFLNLIKKNINDWPSIFVVLFPFYLTRFIMDELISSGNTEKLQQFFVSVVENYRDYKEPFIWFIKNCSEESWLTSLDVRYEKILIGLLHLLEITFREINNRQDLSLNRKINKQISTYLFKEKNLEIFILEADEDAISRLYTLLYDIKDVDPSIKIELKHKIVEKFPDFKFYGDAADKESVSHGGLLVLPKSYEKKQKNLQHLLEVDVPQNSKEIATAVALGDLRENAEYKAAKERQDILNNTAAKMKEDLEKSSLFNIKEIDTTKIGFATFITLMNNSTNKVEEYTILGPWESDPNNNIISYLSPFGVELFGHKVGDNMIFTINDRPYDYTVQDIKEAAAELLS